MRYVVLSDVHSNWEALEAVLSYLEKVKYDKIVFLGDFVGYGANPNECVALLKEIVEYAVLGNHDLAVFNPEEARYFNPYAREAIHWTRLVLGRDNINYLSRLPLSLEIEKGILMVHSTPVKPERWEYLLSVNDALTQFMKFEGKIALFGHSHIPGAFLMSNNGIEVVVERKLIIRENHRYLINPGSVGQPRDMDPRASFGLLDTDAGIFEWHRVEYDIHKAQEKIVKAGLPLFLSERLTRGV
jgi:predicted phosphodiesterase